MIHVCSSLVELPFDLAVTTNDRIERAYRAVFAYTHDKVYLTDENLVDILSEFHLNDRTDLDSAQLRELGYRPALPVNPIGVQ